MTCWQAEDSIGHEACPSSHLRLWAVVRSVVERQPAWQHVVARQLRAGQCQRGAGSQRHLAALGEQDGRPAPGRDVQEEVRGWPRGQNRHRELQGRGTGSSSVYVCGNQPSNPQSQTGQLSPARPVQQSGPTIGQGSAPAGSRVNQLLPPQLACSRCQGQHAGEGQAAGHSVRAPAAQVGSCVQVALRAEGRLSKRTA